MRRCLRTLWRLRIVLILLFGGILVASQPAWGSVSLLLEQPYGELGTFNPTGHSALYFDHICAATPVELRPCGPGELGVVISRYDGIQNYDWVAVPLIPYLYSVDSVKDIPESVEKLTVVRMRDMYRREHLESLAPDTLEGGMPQGNWYELVGSAYDRTIYGFRVKTTPEQDGEIIALFNDRPNVSRYSGAFRNCADFARITIDRLYPHAVRRNYIADFGLTTPKSVARGLTHYAHKHPATDLEVFRIPQVPGDLPRSLGVEGVTESLLKRYGVPMVVLSPHITAAILVAYIGDGRFAVPKTAPRLDLAALQAAADRSTAPVTTRYELRVPPLAGRSLLLNASPNNLSGGAEMAFPLSPFGTASAFISRADCPECAPEELP